MAVYLLILGKLRLQDQAQRLLGLVLVRKRRPLTTANVQDNLAHHLELLPIDARLGLIGKRALADFGRDQIAPVQRQKRDSVGWRILPR